MTLAKTLMVQGTASSVGKSLLVAALCRIYRRRGGRVAPFKAQNMSLNAAVTSDGLEIGRAQAMQAEAAGLAARVEMNPILLKPEGEQRSQLVLMGRPVGHVTAASYYTDDRRALREAIAECLQKLRQEHELVIIEGAGSPAEVNLMHRDLVNMHVARLANAPVVLVGDIDRGGVFASLLGTLDLLDAEDRARVVGLVVNKFRGDPTLFADGAEFLGQRSGKPVLGVVPHVPRLVLPDEDSQSLAERPNHFASVDDDATLRIAVIRLPRISNHDDVLCLEHEPGVHVAFVDHSEDVGSCDLVIVPGSKNTVADLHWLRVQGFERLIAARAQRGEAVLGICGGYQMLGQRIDDPEGVESEQRSVMGLGVLPVVTTYRRHKVTSQVRAKLRMDVRDNLLASAGSLDEELTAYEIHHGEVALAHKGDALFEIQRAGGQSVSDGAVNAEGNVVGTLLHGLFENASLRAALLSSLRRRRGLLAAGGSMLPARSQEYDRLADAVQGALDMSLLDRLIGL